MLYVILIFSVFVLFCGGKLVLKDKILDYCILIFFFKFWIFIENFLYKFFFCKVEFGNKIMRVDWFVSLFINCDFGDFEIYSF